MANTYRSCNSSIQQNDLSFSSSVNHQPESGIYDLTIASATYDRDNGQFECHMKEGGTGRQLHSKAVELTVLLQPSAPSLRPLKPDATEGRLLNLTCSSIGGSPPPEIEWFNKDTGKRVESTLIPGRTKDEPTVAVLAIDPKKKDDGSNFTCTVWNRAMKKEDKFKDSTQIFVKCE